MIYMLYGSLVLLVGIFSGMLVGGAVGMASIAAHWELGLESIASMANINNWAMARSFTLTAVPLFIFMGEIAARSGLVMKLFDSFLLLTKAKVPGGLLQPVIITGTVFAACSGSSNASAAALGSIIYPDLKKKNYSESLSAATLAASGSLAMLIPPSIPLVIFGSLTDVSIGALYLGAIVPGLLISILFITYVAVMVPKPELLMNPEDRVAESTREVTRQDKFRALVSVLAFAGLMFTVLGPLYLGVATATEVAALGSAGAMLLAMAYRKLNFEIIWQSAIGSVVVCGMVYFILFGSMTFSMALSSTGVAAKLPLLVKSIGSPGLTLLLIIFLYLIMGMVLEPISILLLATPFMMPILKGLGFSPIWAGIFVALMIEIALLTPPVGMNLFVIHGSTGVPFSRIVRGAMPFVLILFFVVALIYVFPQLVEWLPSTAL